MSILRSWKALIPKVSNTVRTFSKTSLRQKALENWKRPSIEEILTPKDSWKQVYDRNQKRYNAQLLIGTAVFGVTVFVAGTQIEMNPVPAWLYKHKYSSVSPTIDKSSDDVDVFNSSDNADVIEQRLQTLSDTSNVMIESSTENEDNVAEAVTKASSVEEVAEPATTAEGDAASTKAATSTEPQDSFPVSARNLEPLPEEVPYLLVGAGTASFAAFRAIKSRDPTAKILIIGDEDRIPYMRPPLSKELWFISDEAAKKELRFKQWNGRERSLYFEPSAFYTPIKDLENAKNGGISVATGRKVVRIDAENQIAYLADGAKIKYGKCLLATGGIPRTLPVLSTVQPEVMKKITHFRKVEDFFNLDKVLETSKSVTIFGGGFLGSELACALGQRAKLGLLEVNQAYQEPGNMAKVLPEYLSDWTTEKVKSEGVNVIPNSRIKGVQQLENGRLLVDLSGKSIETDHIVVAVGVEPDHSLAANSNLQVDKAHGGFMVNDQFEASPNLWVAGDAASFLDPQLGRRRVEHHDHAVVSGRLAGENMTGANKSYTHQSMFWSDLGPDVGYEAIGIVDSKLPTVGVFAKATAVDTPKAVVTQFDESDRSISEAKSVGKVSAPEGVATAAGGEEGQDYGKGVIFYLQENKVVGVLLWNVFNRMNIARKVLREGKSYDDLTEVAKLFNIHAEV